MQKCHFVQRTITTSGSDTFFLLCIPLLRTENDFVLVLVLYLFRYSDGALKVLPGYFSLYHIVRENSFKWFFFRFELIKSTTQKFKAYFGDYLESM